MKELDTNDIIEIKRAMTIVYIIFGLVFTLGGIADFFLNFQFLDAIKAKNGISIDWILIILGIFFFALPIIRYLIQKGHNKKYQ